MEVVRFHSRCTPPCCIAYRRAHVSINPRKKKWSPFFVSYLRESTTAVASTFSAQDQRRRQEFRRVPQKSDRPCIPPAMQSFRHIIGGLQGQPSAFLRFHHRLHRFGALPTSESVMPERRMVRRGATAEGRVSDLQGMAPAEPSPKRAAGETATSYSYELGDESDDSTDNAEEEEYDDDDDDYDDDDDDEEGDDDDEDEGRDLDVADEVAPVLPAGTEEDYVEVGYFMSTHGLRGDLRVRSLTDFPEQRFGTGGWRWIRRPGGRNKSLEAVRIIAGRDAPGKSPSWLVRLQGITTIEQAEALVGSTLLVPANERPELEEDEFYSPDLVGMEVIMQSTGAIVGLVESVASTGAGDLLRVEVVEEEGVGRLELTSSSVAQSRGGGGGRLVWIPFVKAIVPVVDRERRRIEITPPQGLMDLNVKDKAGGERREAKKQASRDQRKMKQKVAVVRKRYTAAGQAHVLEKLGEGTAEEKAGMVEQLLEVDLEGLQGAVGEALGKGQEGPPPPPPSMAPPPPYTKSAWASATSFLGKQQQQQHGSDASESGRWIRQGLKCISEGQVAVLVLAGGQGSRLGPTAPPAKGMMDIGLPSGKSLFALQGERLRTAQRLAEEAFPGTSVEIPWIVMTSTATDTPTRDFFDDNNHFGLKSAQVWFVRQANMPAVELEPTDGVHRLLLHSPHSIVEAPAGNGDLFETLHRAGIVEQLHSRGVAQLQVYAVDNALVRVADPLFYGFCHERAAEVGIKVVPKVAPGEAVGVVCLRGDGEGGRKAYGVMEYSEMAEDVRCATEGGGALLYRAAHICVNMFSVEFLRRVGGGQESQLPYHAAKKRVPCVSRGEDGRWGVVEPDKPNGVKLERFIFDAFKFCDPDKVALLEVERREEFSPVKNASGDGVVDSPETAREMVLALHATWRGGETGEVSPLESYAGEGL